MANNLFANIPAIVVAKESTSFASAGLNSTTVEIIYLVGSPIKSFVPGRPINGITAFEEGRGYWIVPKQNMDKEAILIPPIPVCETFRLINSNGNYLINSNGNYIVTQ